jgi:hypothetical protein
MEQSISRRSGLDRPMMPETGSGKAWFMVGLTLAWTLLLRYPTKPNVEADVWMPISDDDVRKMGKDPASSARVPPQYREEYGDGAIVVMEFAHQMHCLVSLLMH